MKATLNDLLNAKGVSEPLREAVKVLTDRLEAAEKERDALRAEIEAIHSLLDNDESKIIRNAKDGYPEWREPKELTLTERVTALCKYAADWKRWCNEAEAKIEQMEKQEPVAFVDYKRGSCVRWVEYLGWQKIKDGTKLYTLPGAQPALPVAEQDQINAEAAIRSIYGARPNDEALWQTIANGMITPAHMAQAVADGTITLAYIMQPAPSVKDAIIDDLQSQFDSEGVAEHGSGDALIRLSDAIAAVEDNFAQPAPGAPWVSLAERMPNPDKHDRVLIYTEGYDFGGEQVFDVKAEALNECRYIDPDEQPETCKAASHWMPHPRNAIFDYAAHCAQPAPSIRPAALFPVIAWLRNGCDPMKAADELEMLAEAPEAKP